MCRAPRRRHRSPARRSPRTPGSAEPQPQPAPAPTPSQPQKQFRLGAASSALVKQARTQTGKGDFGAATATVERALRIEPDNPLLWIELGQVHLAEGNAPQAESMGRKAVALVHWVIPTRSPHRGGWWAMRCARAGALSMRREAYQRANVARSALSITRAG